MELTVKHEVYFTNKELVPVYDIAESLLAFERIVQRSLPVLQKLYPDAQIHGVTVFLPALNTGSIKEDLLVKLLFGNQESLDGVIATARNVGIDQITAHPVLSVVIGIMVTAGAMYVADKFNAKKEAKQSIVINQNIILEKGSIYLNMPPEKIKEAVEAAIPEKIKNANDAVRFIRPAKREPSTVIRLQGDGGVELSADTLKAIPNSLVEGVDETFHDYSDTVVEVRRVDLDKRNQGWAAKIPATGTKKRISLKVAPEVDVKEILADPSFIGDVTVVFRINGDGKRYPKEALLRRITHGRHAPGE